MAGEDTIGERRDLSVTGGLKHPERLRLPIARRQSDPLATEALSVRLEFDKQSTSCATAALGFIEEDPPDLPGPSVQSLSSTLLGDVTRSVGGGGVGAGRGRRVAGRFGSGRPST